MQKENVKCAMGKLKTEWENTGSRGKIEGTRVMEESNRLREKIKVQMVLRVKIRCMREENKM